MYLSQAFFVTAYPIQGDKMLHYREIIKKLVVIYYPKSFLSCNNVGHVYQKLFCVTPYRPDSFYGLFSIEAVHSVESHIARPQRAKLI